MAKAVYIIYLLLILSIITFSPTRYFAFSVIALVSAVPGILYCIKNNRSPIQFSILALFIVTIIAWYNCSFSIRDLPVVNGTQFQLLSSASIWLLSYITMFLSFNNRIITSNNMMKWYFYLFFILGLWIMIEELVGAAGTDEGSNSVYYILPVLPFIISYSKLKIFLTTIVFVLLLITLKRSATLIILLSVVWILFCANKKIIDMKGGSIKIIAIFTLMTALLMYFAGDYVSSILERFISIKDDGGSNRDLIYEYALGLIAVADTKNLLIGYGPRFFWFSNGGISAAHNDFLEITVSCGIIGLIFFIILHYNLVMLIIKHVKYKRPEALPLGICYISFLIWNLVGCQFAYQSTTLCTFMFFAFAECKLKEYENSLHRN